MVYNELLTIIPLGFAIAQYYLGLCYLKGKGVISDRNKALEWYVNF